jgi:hypothetical protein
MMKRNAVTLLTVILLVLFITGSVCAENLTMQFHSNNLRDGYVHTYFSLSGSISYDTIDAIKNGITAKLRITFQLTRSDGFLGLAQNILREKVESLTISYDVWENSYVIEKEEPKSVYNIEKAANIVQKVNEIISPIVIDVASLDTNEEFLLRAKISIQTIKLYPPFGIFLYFFDPWNYESNWIYSQPFTIKK